MKTLNARLLAAHDTQDTSLLSMLYTQAAATSAEPDAAGFYLTQAYIFALEAGLPEAADLHKQLVAMGRDVPG